MRAVNKKTVGILLIGFSVALLVLLGFVKMDMDRKDVFLCEAVEADPEVSMEECPAHTSKSSWVLMVAFGIVFAILIAGVVLAFMRPHVHEAVKVDYSKLEGDEKRIVELLKQHDSSMYQSDLLKELGFSKVKMTRVLDRLESKKIIDRKRRGMTNLVVLR